MHLTVVPPFLKAEKLYRSLEDALEDLFRDFPPIAQLGQDVRVWRYRITPVKYDATMHFRKDLIEVVAKVKISITFYAMQAYVSKESTENTSSPDTSIVLYDARSVLPSRHIALPGEKSVIRGNLALFEPRTVVLRRTMGYLNGAESLLHAEELTPLLEALPRFYLLKETQELTPTDSERSLAEAEELRRLNATIAQYPQFKLQQN